MKIIYLLILVVMFLLFIKGVNSQQLGCCVKTVDNFYCQVSDKDSGECDVNSEWLPGKTNGIDSCSSDVSECEVGCCVLDGVGYPNYYRAQCDDQKSIQDRFVVGNCPTGTDPDYKIGCILDTGECKWWTSEKCSIEQGSVDESINDKNKCNEKTRENEANKRCCKSDCFYKFEYECSGDVGARGVPCGDMPEWCGNNCKWGDDECENKIAKEIGAEVIKKDGCGGIKHLKYCSTEEYCFDGLCKNANCADKKHGDKLCIKSTYEPGSRDILKICEFGVVNLVPCGEFRESICKYNENEMALGCYENVWPYCFDYSGNDEDACKAKGDCEIIAGKCLPLYPPGVEFWLGDKVEKAPHWNDKMCSVNTVEGCERSGDCEVVGIEIAEEGELDCGYGCCWHTYARGKTGSIEKRCDEDFDESILCVTDYTLQILTVRRFTNIPDCPTSQKIGEENYCKNDGKICKVS